MTNEELTPRERILLATSELMEKQGYHATGLNDIVRVSGSPKGSLYHYFPDGKEGLAAETIERRAQFVAARLRESIWEYADPGEGVYQYIMTMLQHMNGAECKRGSPIAAVALETSAASDRLRTACDDAYKLWQAVLQERLFDGGLSIEEAEQLAAHIVAALEGAIILSRTRRDTQPIRDTALMLRRLVHSELGM